jgi:TonB-linked SusC/RagA family outer membrane protein
MKASKNFLILLLALFSFSVAYSQQRTVIRGRVIDKSDKTGVIGANIIEYDKDNRVINGTICDVNGYFALEMKDATHVVKISIIGYISQNLIVDPSKSVIIELAPSTTQLQEVKVLGRKRVEMPSLTNIDDRDNASSVVKVDLGDLKESGVLSATDALQGRVSGLDILASSGDPGSSSQMVIRGLSSMGNNQPLIVIDGVARNPVPQGFNLGSANQEDISNLVNIPVNDIKSITILKDAAATAVYGSQGADGVLVIETNKGRLGKVQFDYAYKTSINIAPPAIPMLNGNEYIMLQLEEWHNANGVFTIPSEIAYDPTYVDFYNYSKNTDWIKAITKNGITNDHYFSVSGGGEKTRYFTSVSYVDEGGTTINTDSKRFSTRINLDYFLSDKLMFSVNFNYTNNTTANNLELKTNWGGPDPINIRAMAYVKAPNMSIWKYDANGNPTGEYFTPITSYQGSGSDYFNPVAISNLGSNTAEYNSLQNAFTLRYNILDWLIFRETLSFQYDGTKSKNYLPYSAMGSDFLAWTVNKAEEGNSLSSDLKTESQLAFNFNLDTSKHVFSGTLNWLTDQSGYNWMDIQSNKNPSTSMQEASNPNGQINYIGNGSGETRKLGALATLNYKFLDRYLVQTSFRSDANTSFGLLRRWGSFGGISTAWRFSQEPFIKSLGFIGESMLHASWGVSGREPDSKYAYARFATFNVAPNGGYGILPGIIPSQPALDKLQWENISSTDLGLKLNLFGDKIYIETDLYRKLTTNLLFTPYAIPTSSGYPSLLAFNGGSVENKGWEFSVEYKIIQKKDFRWTANLNISHNVNSFLTLPDNFNIEQSTSIGNGQYPLRVSLGAPIGSFFGFRYLGVYSSDADAYAKDANGNVIRDNQGSPVPMNYNGTYIFKGGDAKYADINHDGKIDLNDVVYLGNSNPKLFGGFGTGVIFKNLEISCQFYYRLGFDIINAIASQTQGMLDKNNQSTAVLRRWRAQGQVEPDLLPRAYLYSPANNLGSDRYVENGDFVRLLNVQLSYRFTKEFCDKLKMRSLAFTLSARKLLTFTQYSGQDPEIGLDASNPFAIGYDYARTPPPRIITANISIGF